jgi:histidinol dehydrogenase
VPGVASYPPPKLAGVLNRIDLRGSTADPRRLLPRAALDVAAAMDAVRSVVEAVRERGASAVRDATERFDGVRLDTLRVPTAEIGRAVEALDPAVRAALLESIARARAVHADQRRTDTTTQVVPGGTVTQRWRPVERVGSTFRAASRSIRPAS